MKKELLFSLSLAAASLTASFNCAADWQDTTNLAPEPPPEELTAAAAAAAAPGAAVAAPAPAAPSAPAVAAPIPTQVDVQPAPVAAPPPEESSTPAPAARAAKNSAIVLHRATLRTRPTSAGTGDPIAAETRVRMESSVRNADGNWWFVTATGIGGGWLLESELGDPQN